MRNKLFLIFLVFILTHNISFGQDQTKRFGIVLMEDFTSQPLNYGFSLWINKSTSIELIGGFESMDIEDNSGTKFNIGVGGLYHFGIKKLLPFAGARFLFSGLTISDKSYSDILLAIVFGAEYFFSEWISLSGEFQFNYIETDSEFSPGGYAANAKIYKTGRFLVLRFYL